MLSFRGRNIIFDDWGNCGFLLELFELHLGGGVIGFFHCIQCGKRKIHTISSYKLGFKPRRCATCTRRNRELGWRD